MSRADVHRIALEERRQQPVARGGGEEGLRKWALCEKTDGERRLLWVRPSGAALLVDRAWHFTQASRATRRAAS